MVFRVNLKKELPPELPEAGADRPLSLYVVFFGLRYGFRVNLKKELLPERPEAGADRPLSLYVVFFGLRSVFPG